MATQSPAILRMHMRWKVQTLAIPSHPLVQPPPPSLFLYIVGYVHELLPFLFFYEEDMCMSSWLFLFSFLVFICIIFFYKWHVHGSWYCAEKWRVYSSFSPIPYFWVQGGKICPNMEYLGFSDLVRCLDIIDACKLSVKFCSKVQQDLSYKTDKSIQKFSCEDAQI